MMKNYGEYNRNVLLGCGVVILVLVLIAAAMLANALLKERSTTRYPGSNTLTSHSNYTGLPSQFRWDNSYRTYDSFTDVYEWYSMTFDLGAEARAIGDCILLEGTAQRLIWQRQMSVILCDTLESRLIYVTRSTAWR